MDNALTVPASEDTANRSGTYTATFAPQAWQNDQAVPVDAVGAVSWDCAAFAHLPGMLDYLSRAAARSGGSLEEGVLDYDDRFKDDPAAPQWIRDWMGPFDITVTARNAG